MHGILPGLISGLLAHVGLIGRVGVHLSCARRPCSVVDVCFVAGQQLFARCVIQCISVESVK